MMKRPALLVLALFLLVGASLKPCCRVSVCSREIPGLFSEKTVNEAIRTAKVCAGEICEGCGEMPYVAVAHTLSLKAPEGTAAELSDAILSAVPGIEKSWCVYVGDRLLGTVESRERLEECMRAYIINTMPDGAEEGSFTGDVRVERVYTRTKANTNERDMVLLLSGAAPVMYTEKKTTASAG